MRADLPKRCEAAIAALAAQQEGLLRPDDLLRLGLGPKAIAYRARVQRLFVPLPGVYSLGPGPFPRRTAWLAAVWWCAPDAVLSHFSAGVFLGHGDEPDPDVVHVTTTRDVRSRAGVEVHRTRHLDRLDWSQHGPLGVTNRSRTLLDEASLLGFPAFRARADRLRELPVAELRAALERAPGRQGSTAVRRLLAGDQVRTKSFLERRYLRFCHRHGVPRPPELNAWIAGHKADCVYPAERLVIELDGRAHHERRAQMEADRRRDADYQLAHFRILRLTWWDLEPELAARTAATIRAFIEPRHSCPHSSGRR